MMLTKELVHPQSISIILQNMAPINIKTMCNNLTIEQSNIAFNDISMDIKMINLNICLCLNTDLDMKSFFFKCIEKYEDILDNNTIHKICLKLKKTCKPDELVNIVKNEFSLLRDTLKNAKNRLKIKELINTNMFTYEEFIEAAENLENSIKTKQNIPQYLSCPLTHTIFIDPVNCSDGYTYEKKAIEYWMMKKLQSPMTQEKISMDFYSNMVVQWSIDELCNV